VTQGEALIGDLKAKAVIADKGYDSERLVEAIRATGAEVVIPPRSNRKEQREYDRHLYKQRNGVERCVSYLKQYRRVATRYEKRGRNYLALVYLAATRMLLR
jgi:putative transposase